MGFIEKLLQKKSVQVSISVFICLLAGGIGSVFTTPSIPTWYAGLQKPWFNPPNWIFGPVWTVLYVLMGIAAYLIWQKGWKKAEVQVALAVFGLQLVLNTVWSIVFFGVHSLGGAFIFVVMLWLSILASIILFWRQVKIAAIILLPYIAWVSFAGFLNWVVWGLNG
ncbi:MAG: TspO/MBR family protein [bacterium]